MASGLIVALRDPDLHKKIFFTLTMIILCRIGSQIPTPGIDYQLVSAQLEQISKNQSDVYSLINLFSGGALLQMMIFGVSIMPYIAALIIVQLLTVVIPHFEQLKKEGRSGQAEMTQYTRYLTVALALLQSAGIVTMTDRGALLGDSQSLLVRDAGVFGLVVIVVVMTADAILVMWMDEFITDRGVGNGMSLLIFAGIAAGMPAQGANILRSTTDVVFVTVVVAILVLIIGVIFIEQGQRRVPMQYARRMVGRRQYGRPSTHLPLKVSQAGIIPVIFASSLIYVPVLITQTAQSSRSSPDMDSWWQRSVIQYLLAPSSWQYILLFFLMIIFSSFFCTSVQYGPHRQAGNMKKYGRLIPDFCPGRPAAGCLSYVLIRLLTVGSLYLALITALPNIALDMEFGNASTGTSGMFEGAALLILVNVALTTVKRVESQMVQRNYEGFLR